MAFSILSSNRIEKLQQSMCRHLAQQPPGNVFACEIIVVPTFAMARWLNLQQAQQQGIAANIDYPQPAEWIWQLAASLLERVPPQDPLTPETSCWNIFSLLPGMLKQRIFAPLRQYLHEDEQGIKRWQLANRIAEVFERYQHYRPSMIREWSQGKDDQWQAQLWRALIEDHQLIHRTAVLGQLVAKLHGDVDLRDLPERVSLFALSSLPPSYIEVILALARHIDITLYQHNPTDQYWADLKSGKSHSRRLLSNPQAAEYDEAGNELLASWGRQGQVFQDLLLDQDSGLTSDLELFQAPGSSTLLRSIQQSIFDLDADDPDIGADASLSIHLCHSPMRECQVLHDQLLAMLDRDPELSTEDILVMMPEISRYAPYIEAVFGKNETQTRPSLRWNLSDITLADEHPLVLSFVQLLKLPGSRFKYSEIIAYLEIEEIRHRFDIDETALEDIRSMLEETRVRWGIDEAHKAALGLPPAPENTWQQARQRIFAGYALTDVEYWDGIAPLHGVEGERAQNLGKFWFLFERLLFWREQLNLPCRAQEWQSRLNRLLEDLFVERDPRVGRLQQIRDAISELSLAGDSIISPALLIHWMEQQLARQETRGRLFSGGITFCGMRPMRSLPFRVICLLGMNENAFPRRETPVEFDLMARKWQPGDPLKSDEDRYLMLETLLCARQALYISYCGRSLKDNSHCQPSVLVQQLIDFIDARFDRGIGSEQRLSDEITTVHPMQTFATGNFSPYALSYDSYWCSIANEMRMPAAQQPGSTWPTQALASASGEALNINLGQLRRFLQHPIKYFFNQRLNLWLAEQQIDDDEELFSLEGLDKWRVRQRLAEDFLVRGETRPGVLQAEGALPHGHAAVVVFEQATEEMGGLLSRLEEFRGISSEARAFEHQFETHGRLSGRIGQYYPGRGLMHFATASLQGKYLLSLWLDHLALCASNQLEGDETSSLIWRDGNLQFGRLEAGDAREQLLDYLAMYRTGLDHPLPVFPGASYVWSLDGSLSKALKKWHGDDFRDIPGDKHNAYVQLALRNAVEVPIPGPEFETCAKRIYARAHQSTVES
ncbi:MAG: exodeoxyribonuclease V subunit gamma [Gammaproteobacteria bacterium]